jgi:hypothetical protein
VPFWRRGEQTLNERLAREAGLSLSGEPAEAAAAEERRSAEGDDLGRVFKRLTQPISDLAVIHGAHRAREWDAVATVEAAGIDGDAVHFVALPEGALVVDEEIPEGALDRLADAVEASLAPPYRAEAVRRGGRRADAHDRRIRVRRADSAPRGARRDAWRELRRAGFPARRAGVGGRGLPALTP